MGVGVGQELFFGRQPRIDTGIFDRGRVDLGELITKQVDFTGASAFVAAHTVELHRNLACAYACGAQRV